MVINIKQNLNKDHIVKQVQGKEVFKSQETFKKKQQFYKNQNVVKENL